MYMYMYTVYTYEHTNTKKIHMNVYTCMLYSFFIHGQVPSRRDGYGLQPTPSVDERVATLYPDVKRFELKVQKFHRHIIEEQRQSMAIVHHEGILRQVS